jgi:hypothetical protein
MNEAVFTHIDKIKTEEPKTYRACYPRQITTPGGFTNPRLFTASLHYGLAISLWPEVNMLPHLTAYLSTLTQITYKVPTYFVRSEFAQAVAQTNPPEDFKIGEIKWPLPAMLFVLPTDFILKYFGFYCPFLSVARAEIGVYPDILKLPETDIPKVLMNDLRNDAERMLVTYPVYSSINNFPIDYSGAFNFDHNIADVAKADFHDATYVEEAALGIRINTDAVDVPSGEAERKFQDKMMTFAIKLMLALTARPDLIKVGQQTRKHREIKHSRRTEVREALWSANTIGWEYRATRERGGHAQGTHASPRLHWRRGHMRNQPYGEKLTLRKLLWIEPVLVNAPE